MELTVKESPTIDIKPDAEDRSIDDLWRCVLFNDEVHEFDQVVRQVMKAAKVNYDTAYQITLRAHNYGSSVVMLGSEEECDECCAILREIELNATVERA